MKHLIKITPRGKAYNKKNVPWHVMMNWEITFSTVINPADPKAMIKEIIKL